MTINLEVFGPNSLRVKFDGSQVTIGHNYQRDADETYLSTAEWEWVAQTVPILMASAEAAKAQMDAITKPSTDAT